MKTPMHNYFKGIVAENSAYYPYSIFGRNGYTVPPEIDLRIQYRFSTYHTIGHAVIMAIYIIMMIIFSSLKIVEPTFIFIIYVITLPLMIMVLNWGIAGIIANELRLAENPIGFRQRVREIFSQSHHSKILSFAGVIALLALFIFIPSPKGMETRAWIAAMCLYDFIVSWVI